MIGFNRPVDEETAREIAKTFVEAIAAPDYTRGSAGGSGREKELARLEVNWPRPTAWS